MVPMVLLLCPLSFPLNGVGVGAVLASRQTLVGAHLVYLLPYASASVGPKDEPALVLQSFLFLSWFTFQVL